MCEEVVDRQVAVGGRRSPGADGGGSREAPEGQK